MGILQLQHFPLCFSSAFSEQLGSSDLPVQPLVSCGSIHLPANRLKLFKGSNLYKGNHIRVKAPAGSRSSYNRVGQVGKISAIMGSPVSIKGRGELKVFDNGDDLKASLADFVAALSESAVKERGAFSVVLSGGSLINALRGCWQIFLSIYMWKLYNHGYRYFLCKLYDLYAPYNSVWLYNPIVDRLINRRHLGDLSLMKH